MITGMKIVFLANSTNFEIVFYHLIIININLIDFFKNGYRLTIMINLNYNMI